MVNPAASSVGPSEDSPDRKNLTNAELAAHWSVSLPYLTKLKKPAPAGKGMPDFTDLDTADRWRALHAPPRGRRSFGKNRVENPPHPRTPQDVGTENEGATGAGLPANNDRKAGSSGGGEVINIGRFIRKTGDFDGLMLRQAEEVPQIAFGLLKLAAAKNDTVEVSAQLKNWGDAGKVSGAVREKFLETQEKSRALLSLDEVEDIVGTGLQELRNAMLKHDDRVAAALVPHLPAEQLALVRRAVAEDIDMIFRKMDAVPDRTRRELVAS